MNEFKYPNSPLLTSISNRLRNNYLDETLLKIYESLSDEQRYKVDVQEMFWHITEENTNQVVDEIDVLLKMFPDFKSLIQWNLKCVYSYTPESKTFQILNQLLNDKFSINVNITPLHLGNAYFGNICLHYNFTFPNEELYNIMIHDNVDGLTKFMENYDDGFLKVVCCYAALQGAINCFKYAFHHMEDDEVSICREQFLHCAIIGKNLNIFMELEHVFALGYYSDRDEYRLKLALKYHNWEVVKWLHDNAQTSYKQACHYNVVFNPPVYIYSELLYYVKGLNHLSGFILSQRPDIITHLPQNNPIRLKLKNYEDTTNARVEISKLKSERKFLIRKAEQLESEGKHDKAEAKRSKVEEIINKIKELKLKLTQLEEEHKILKTECKRLTQ